MNWIRENKFLTGFFAVLLIGGGVLGFLLYSAWGKFSEVTDTYNQQADTLHKLQSVSPYPDDETLKKVQAQKQQVEEAIANLQKNLSAIGFEQEPVTPEKFQDDLRAAVSKISDKAKANGVALPKPFYLGFEAYQTTLPRPEATTALGRQLQAIAYIVNILLDDKVDSLNDLKRTPVPEEQSGGGTAATAGGRPPGGAPGPGGARPGQQQPQGKQMVSKIPFDIDFSADQARLRKVLNDITASKKQFYIIRTLVVKNQTATAPPRGGGEQPGAPGAPEQTAAAPGAPAPGAAPATADQSSGAAAGASPAPALKYVVGTEKLTATMRLEIVDFTPPAAAASPAKSAAKATPAK